MKIFKKAVLPEGFKATAVSSGIKKSGKLDLALFYSAIPARAACLFTSNSVQAAPIAVCKKHLKKNAHFRAIIANSGNANCFTGSAGIKDAEETVRLLSAAAGISKGSVLTASTGIIGKRLPILKIKKAMPGLLAGLSMAGINKAKKAILTTDTFAKEITAKLDIAGSPITICGIAKGAGMIAPNMATMLCFIFTDASFEQKALAKVLKNSVQKSFNCITVDGCMSTNDTVIILANGASKNHPIEAQGKDFNSFLKALDIVCLELAKSIVKDAEGASKFIQIKVNGAGDFLEARLVALAIANSNLFKTAVYGENPNFGRIAAAIGSSGTGVQEKDIKIKVGSLKKKDITVNVSINRGNATAAVYTSDLTPEYIKINAEYN